ncbi:MAG: sigma-70 family RNA polymerase sigma factor [Spirochaetales bacterium]|jgi:RNA polymerase sigma-70 factor (ECF subfamily)|nr:sigma-70 family RNA polymerase sigma factor [Spirochaetales bacterium]
MIKNSDTWLNKIFLQYRDKVLGYFRRRLSSPEEAEDLVSQVFLEVTRCAERYDETRASESTWIYTICRNLCNRHLRDTYKSKEFVKTDENIQAHADITISETEKFIHADALAKGLAKLNEDKRNVILLSYYYGLSNEEIAKKTKMSYTNVCTLKSRGLKELKGMLEEFG